MFGSVKKTGNLVDFRNVLIISNIHILLTSDIRLSVCKHDKYP